jgi:hypothetical protein
MLLSCIDSDYDKLLLKELGPTLFSDLLVRLSETCTQLNTWIQSNECVGLHRLFANEDACRCGGEVTDVADSHVFRHVCRHCARTRDVIPCKPITMTSHNLPSLGFFKLSVVALPLAGMPGELVHFMKMPVASSCKRRIDISFVMMATRVSAGRIDATTSRKYSGIRQDTPDLFASSVFTVSHGSMPTGIGIVISAELMSGRDADVLGKCQADSHVDWYVGNRHTGDVFMLTEADMSSNTIRTHMLENNSPRRQGLTAR